jgi:hypothetical protein
MATLANLQDDGEDPTAAPAQDADADEQGGPTDADPDDSGGDQPDGGNPDHMIGYIDPRLPAKVRVFLRAIRLVLLTPTGERALKKAVGSENPPEGIAMLVGKSIESAQNHLGPLNDQEHDQVAMFVTGWLVSSLQKMGMPGLEDAGGRHDLIGRVLQALDKMTGGQQQGPPDGAQDAQGGPPGPPPTPGGPGGPAAPPDDQGGTLSQLGGP